MRFNKLVVVLVSICLVILSSPVHAADKKSVLEMQSEKFADLEINVEVMEDDEVEKVKNEENKIQQVNSFKESLKDKGFKKMRMKKKDTNLKYWVETEKGAVHSYIVNEVYKNKDKVVVTQTTYDGQTEEIQQFYANQRSMSDLEQSKDLINYKNQIVIDDVEEDDGINLSSSFKWNGKSFACSMAGVLACGHHCAIWAIIHPIAGGSCTVLCGAAFAIGCSMT